MELTEVKQRIIYSLSKNSSSNSGVSSVPRIISLFGVNKKQKASAVEQAFVEYTRGNETIILLSVSTSSKLFQYILSHAPQIWFIEGRVTEQNKKKDVLALMFTYQRFII